VVAEVLPGCRCESRKAIAKDSMPTSWCFELKLSLLRGIVFLPSPRFTLFWSDVYRELIKATYLRGNCVIRRWGMPGGQAGRLRR